MPNMWEKYSGSIFSGKNKSTKRHTFGVI